MASRSSTTSMKRLQGVLSKMKVRKTWPASLTNYGNSELLDYATNKRDPHVVLKSNRLPIWSALYKDDIKSAKLAIPRNGFEDMIQLTEENKLWKYPIDNEQGMEEEQAVPFEEHVFFDHRIDDFPANEDIRFFMRLVFQGLGQNPYMTAKRKNKIIDSYLDYFNEKKESYKEAGFDLDK